MRLRRILLALGVSAAVGLATGCAQASDGATPAAGATTSAAAASPSADAKADTAAVCAGVVAAYEKEQTELTAALGALITASASDDKAALATAKAKGEVVVGRLAKAVDAEIANAADPAAKAALQEFVATFAKVLTPEGLDDPAFEAKMDTAAAEAGKFCPALLK